MNINDLKKMIAEEYKYWMAEQEPAMDMPEPPMGAAPKIDVGPDDIDAGGDENPEETLRDIYDMLKDYFEGGDAGEESPAEEDEDEEDEEVTETDKKEDTSDKDKDAKNESKNLNESKKTKKQVLENLNKFKSKQFISRFQKLANIK